MDHNEAVRLQSAERYVLGELSAADRELFEEHYFDCPECLADLKALGSFIAAGKMVLAEPESTRQPVPVPSRVKPRTGSWLLQLRPAYVLPVVALLGATVAYQNLVTIPSLKGRDSGAVGQPGIYTASFHLQGPARGDVQNTIAIVPHENFGLDFDFTPSRAAASYEGKLVDADGQAFGTFTLPGDQANREAHLFIAGGAIRPGTYTLVFVGDSPAAGPNSAKDEVYRVSFTVEFRR